MRKPQIKIGDLVSLEKIEKEHIKAVMEATPTLLEAAAVLEIEESTLWRKRRKWEKAHGA